MTRRSRLDGPAACLLALALLHPARADAREDRMAAIVADVRAQEAKYRDIEYVLKITSCGADRRTIRSGRCAEVAGARAASGGMRAVRSRHPIVSSDDPGLG